MTNFNQYENEGNYKEKSLHDLSHKNIFEARMGNLIPFLFEDIVPGDEIDLNSNIYIKFAPLVAPQMSEIEINIRYFFVPFRLLFDGFHQFYARQEDLISVYDEIPHIRFSNAEEFEAFYNRYGKLYRHFGLAEYVDSEYITEQSISSNYPSEVNLMPMRAYNQIFYYYYLPLDRVEANVRGNIFREIATRKATDGYTLAEFKLEEGAFIYDDNTSASNLKGYYQAFNYGDYYSQVKSSVNITDQNIGSTMSSFKLGASLQKFFNTVLGSKGRFNKFSNLVFGVSPRLDHDRPIYIGGMSNSALIGDVEANTEGTGQPLGSYAGKGTGYVKKNINFKATEFGYVVGILDITPKIQYAGYEHERISGIDYLDIFRPQFENAYINTVKLKHAFRDYTHGSATGEETYGYSTPYNQYRFPRNTTYGTLARTLDYWNVINKENTNVLLNPIGQLRDFNDPGVTYDDYWYDLTSPLFAVPTEPQMFVEAWNGLRLKRIVKHELNSVLTS